ncbi:MAG TPA: DUF1318 domain-containing protein [Brevundimonas sp.]
MTFRKLFVVGAAILALGVAAGAAFAQTSEQKAMIDAAKAQGIVGEQADGYVGIREPGSVSAELRAAITAMNSARRDAYARSAAEAGDGATTEAAGARMFERLLFPRITTGQWYRNSAGQWQRR